MRILGIDYGRRKIGLAIGVSGFAEPWKVVNFPEFKKILETEKFDKLVVGVSEGKMAENTKDFVKTIQPFINSTIILHDETLSTKDAIRLSIEAGIGRNKRKKMEDAYAASIMLQDYLDS